MTKSWKAMALSLLVVTGLAGADDPIDGPERTLGLELWSDLLGEHREFRVRLPTAYHEDPERRFPVFYVSDADWNFPLVAETLDYLAHWGRIPPFIVVGALNVSRNRDFLPRADAAFPSSGGGDRYLQHITEEWIPWVDARYRTSEHRVLFGHSFGGVLVLNQLFTDPGVFDAHISLGASVWVADEVVLERAGRFFDEKEDVEGWLYLSVGEGDGGATVPAGRKLADLLDARAPDTLEWRHSVMPRETHFTNVPISLHRALAELFPTWGDDEALAQQARSGGADAVESWFSDRRDRLGWRFVPQGLDLGLAALRLVLDEHQAAGFAAFDAIQSALPDSPEVVQLRGQALAGVGRVPEALSAIDRALKMAREGGYHEDSVRRFEDYRKRVAGADSE